MFYRYHSLVTISVCWLFYFLVTLPVISQSKAYTWFKAQKECRKKNQSLSLWKNESTSFYWTGFYKKRSQWIKIIGCYATSEIQNNTNKTFKLSISSPPLCQERCLQEKINLFALQAETCICLSDRFENLKNQLASTNCTYTCNESKLLSTECGGESAFNVFLTDTTDLNVHSRCLSLQCGADPKFLDEACNKSLLTICIKSVNDTTYGSWKKKKEYCKSNGVYPIGNLSLLNKRPACTDSVYNDSSPRWVGIVKDVYQSEEQGQLITNSDLISIKQCIKCRFNYTTEEPDCKYDRCNDNLNTKVYCSKRADSTTPLPENTDTIYSETATITSSTSVSETTSIGSFDLKNTESNDESASIIVPVIIVPLVLFLCAVAIILYIRKKKQIKEKDTNGGKTSPKVESTNYSNVENHTDNNYFVLQKSNPSYELAGECIVGSESPYNETEDGTYDHLGNKDARKTSAEDIYNHTSSAGLTDLSDYDTANHKRLNEEDSTYDHAGVGDNSYGHFDLHQIKETDYSVLS